MYFCQPPAASALSTVSAVCATESGEVKIVVAGLAKTSLAPATLGRRLVLNVPSSGFSGLDSEHPPASTAKQANAKIKPRDLPPKSLPPNPLSPPMVNSSVRMVISEKPKPTAPAASGWRNAMLSRGNGRFGSKTLQIAPQIGRRILGLPIELERRDEAALLVHQIDQRGVIHAIVAVVGGNFLGVDPVGLHHRVDRLGIAGGAAQMRSEARQITLRPLLRVALRIDGDEPRADAVGVVAERAHDLLHFEPRGRADVGTVPVTEENQEGSALHVLVGDRLAVLVDQFEGTADRRRAEARSLIMGREKNDAEKDDEAGQEGGEDQKNVRCSGRHRASIGLHQKHAAQPARTTSRNTAVP